MSLLEPGSTDFNKLKDLTTILISPFDIFGYKLYRYTFEERCVEVPELRLDDGARRIFINTKGKNPEGFTEEFLELMEYINHTTDEVAEKVKSEKIKKIHDRVRTVKESEKVGVKLMQKWEELAYAREEGELEGEKKGERKGELVLLVSQVCRKMKRGLTPETIADQLERELPEIKRICDVIEDTADYDEKKIVEKLMEERMCSC